MKLSKQDYKLGALYRIGVQRSFDRDTLARLLVERANFTEKSAIQLVGHWLTTEPYRVRA